MYAIGLPAAVAAARAASWTTVVAAALSVLVAIRALLAAAILLDGASDSTSTPFLPSSWKHVYAFFWHRFDFLHRGFTTTNANTFRFSLLGYPVYAVSGEACRKAVLGATHLDLNEGFKVLSGAIPIVAGITSELPTKALKLIHKRLGAVQTHDRLTRLIPLLLEDCRRITETWPLSGTFDPFARLHEVAFQLTIRALSCAELADDVDAVSRLHRLYDTLDRGNTPVAVLLPWLPGPSTLRNTWASKRIYDTFFAAIQRRQESLASGTLPVPDTLQMLLEEGTDPQLIVGFMMGLVVAGSRSTGTTASWVLTLLGSHPSWLAATVTELEDLIHSHAVQGSGTSIHSQLASVPLEAWETATPVTDKVIRETLRLAQPHVAMRRNMGPELTLPGGTTVPTGAFVVYPFADVHLDPTIYPDPWLFDPSRPEPKGVELGYIGWGGGKTVCAGQRLARLTLKILVASFTLSFDHHITDQHGRPTIPRPDWNDKLTCKPVKTCALQYTRK